MLHANLEKIIDSDKKGTIKKRIWGIFSRTMMLQTALRGYKWAHPVGTDSQVEGFIRHSKRKKKKQRHNIMQY